MIFDPTRRVWRPLILVTALLAAMLWSTGLALPRRVLAASPIRVDSFGDIKADDGLCTLREAIIAANKDRAEGGCPAGDGADTILLPPGIYTLTRHNNGSEDASTTGDLDIRHDLTIQPAGPGLVVIDGGAEWSRFFEIIDGDAGWSRVFEIIDGDVTLRDLTIRNGGEIWGAGIYVDEHADLTLENVTLTANYAFNRGGALYVEEHANVYLTNVTILGNRAWWTGGALYAEHDGDVTMVNTIIGANGDAGAPACAGDDPEGAGPNLVADPSCTTDNTVVAADLGLTALTGDGGVTFWMLTETSPALDAGSDAACPATDQLGAARPQRAHCDIGAHELDVAEHPPTVSAVDVATGEDTPVTVTLSGFDPDGNALTFTIDQPPATGTLGPVVPQTDIAATTLYTPPTNFNGVVTFSYVASDGGLLSVAASVTVTVAAVNDGPVAANDTLTTDEDTPGTVNVAANDSDPDGDLNPASVSIAAQPEQGSAAANGDGSVTYTPPANWSGATAFQYTICDSSNDCATASVSVTVKSVNDAPLAAGDWLTVTEDISGTVSVVGNDTDADGNLDPATVSITDQPSQGSAVAHDDGTVTYTPPVNWHGDTAFTYAVCDTTGACATATVQVTVTPDAFLEVMTVADDGPGSLRDMLTQANADPDLSAIVFAIPGAGPHVILLDTALPAVQYPINFDGTTQPQGQVILDGQNRDFPGLVILDGASSSTVKGLTFRNFGGHGIVLQQSGGNTLVDNTLIDNGGDGIAIHGDAGNPIGTGGNVLSGNVITGNGGNGVTIVDSVQNDLTGNDIVGNGGLSVDLGGDGRTSNDPQDTDGGANLAQNYPSIFRAAPIATTLAANGAAPTLQLDGWLDSTPNQTFTLRVYVGASCGSGDQRLIPVTPATVTTGNDGVVYFSLTTTEPVTLDQGVRVTATDADGNTSEYSDCIVVAYANDSWPFALPLDVSHGPATVRQYLDLLGQSRWYRFTIQPQSRVEILLTDLPANYDLTLYKDLAAAYQEMLEPQDPDQLSAEYAPSAFSPSAFSPSAFSPSAFSPSAFSPSAFSPSAFSPSAFSPSAFSPSAFSPSAFSPSAFSPSAFSPSAFSPSAFSPSAFSPSAFSPSAFSPSAFSGTQTRSLIGVSAFNGTAGEGIAINTWNNTGEFYVRVRGREGAFSLDAPFKLQVTLDPGPCADLPADSTLPAGNLAAAAGNYKSILLVDEARLRARYAAADVNALLAQLGVLAARPEVQGAIVDVNDDARIAAANARADAYTSCPYAKNVVAESIRRVVRAYNAVNPLEYVVIVGNDDVIPFFRYPDSALLGPESDFEPPVKDESASQASLRLGYVLSQDAYGASIDLSLNAAEFPVPDLAVGRLVETPGDILTLLAAYLTTPGGVAPTPHTAFVTGYDFLEDAALAVQSELAAGINAPVDSLITPADVSPLDPSAWTATQLKEKLAGQRYDIAFLAGHFNAVSALAADYRTSFLTTDLLALPTDLTNALYFSAGCHSGYNIVTPDGITGVTFEPDWAQAFAQRGATLVAGTGYQYGDTQFLEYSERLYLEFTRKLRTGDGPVPVGKALVAAKQQYLATTPFLRGIHEKAVLEATLFGLPMFAINLPGDRLPADDDAPVIEQAQAVTGAPGQASGLHFADLTVTPRLAERVLQLSNVDDGATVEARWLEGSDGVVTNPAEPALPLESMNVTVSGLALRGVGFRGGAYSDVTDILPLTGAPTTELRGVHALFQSEVWFPLRPWGVNYFGALAGTGNTRFNVTPAQHKSSSTGGLTNLRRQFSRLNFRLFYTPKASDVAAAADGQGQVADVPAIVQAQGFREGGDVVFRARVVGNPAAGLQGVWVTYTAVQGPWFGSWQSLDLTQSAVDSTLWEGRLPLNGADAADVRFIVQAVNGVGLVAMAENLGRYYTPDNNTGLMATTLELLSPAVTAAPVGDQAVFAAMLRDADGHPLANLPLVFGVGPQNRLAVTDADGRAQASIPMMGLPGHYLVTVAFDGNDTYAAAAANNESFFDILRQTAVLTLDPPVAQGTLGATGLITATLVDAAGRRLVEQTVFFEVRGNQNLTLPVITNMVGQATLGAADLAPGTYTVVARYNGASSHAPTTSAVGQLLLGPTIPTDEIPTDQPGRDRLFLPMTEHP